MSKVDSFVLNNWMERLYFERLEEKSIPVLDLLTLNKNNWEATCFCLIAKAFGGNTNGNAFFEMAQSIPFSIIQKENSIFNLEALFMGQCNMLNKESDDPYELELYNEYSYLKKKFRIDSIKQNAIQFFRLRPQNFPTIRLSQLATLFSKSVNLFQLIKEINEYEKLNKVLSSVVSEYWITHYTFGKVSKTSVKKTSESFLKIVCLNAVIPLRFLAKKMLYGSTDYTNELLLLKNFSPEKNSIVSYYETLGLKMASSMHSQAVLTLNKKYCKTNSCLQCQIGVFLFKN